MKKIILISVLSILVLLFLMPIPHGGTIGGNFFESLVDEVKTYFTPEAKEAREKEDKAWELQKDKARESWGKFEKKPQYFNSSIAP